MSGMTDHIAHYNFSDFDFHLSTSYHYKSGSM